MKYYSIFSSVAFALLSATKVDVSAHQENEVAGQPNHRHRHLRATARNIPQVSPTTADPASSSLIMVSADAGDIRDYDHCLNNCQYHRTVACVNACNGKADCVKACDLNPFFEECDSFCTSAAMDAEMLPLTATTMKIGVEEQGESGKRQDPFVYGHQSSGAGLPPAANPDSLSGVNPYDKSRRDPFEDSHQSSGAGLPPADNPDSPPEVNPYYDSHRQDPFEDSHQSSGAGLPPAANPDSPPEVNPYYDNNRYDPAAYGNRNGAWLPPAANPDSPPGVRPYYDSHRQDPAYNPPGVHSDYELPMGGGESAVIIE